ncbi:F-box domain [Arabidopsis thaliana x Arabidopsis arenosa]|uniref:F-box domain n=1 Tax=Arabidopsis thaliana x Arabidopsis arenosa TaxID=1240361 RepID=A0A8T1YVM9_9BRAS|nr:F-box domain [Arabidopsis thaliana x Arabidopsis arenosa]
MENNPQIRSSDYLPEDLIAQILVKLPSKSVAKLIVVSKLWSSIIRSKSFIDLYLERSLTRPCLLFSFHRINRRFFHSISQEAISEEATPECSYTNTSSFPLSLDTRLPPLSYNVCTPVRGLICCQDLDKVVVSNPSTGQFLVLPKLNTKRKQISRFFGYDPIEDEYKVLCMTVLQVSYDYVVSEEHQVFTLGGTEKKEEATWRMITCKVPHCPATQGICIDGVVYYGAWSFNSKSKGSLIVGFDVRLEEFTLVKLPDGVEIYYSELVNYQRKVALANHSYNGKFELWVLDKQEWSKISVMVPSWKYLFGRDLFRCRGAISSGKFIFTPLLSAWKSVIIIYDRKEEIARRVEIEGMEDRAHHMKVFLDHVECPILF